MYDAFKKQQPHVDAANLDNPCFVNQVGGNHYQLVYQHWDLVADCNLSYLEACATKYVSRYDKKNGLEDLRKAETYVEKRYQLLLATAKGDVPTVYTLPTNAKHISACTERFLSQWSEPIDNKEKASQVRLAKTAFRKIAVMNTRPAYISLLAKAFSLVWHDHRHDSWKAWRQVIDAREALWRLIESVEADLVRSKHPISKPEPPAPPMVEAQPDGDATSAYVNQ